MTCIPENAYADLDNVSLYINMCADANYIPDKRISIKVFNQRTEQDYFTENVALKKQKFKYIFVINFFH